MPTYPTYKLGDVAEIINGKNQKEVVSTQGEYPIYGSGGIIGWATDYLCKGNSTIIGRKGTIDNPIFVNQKFWNVDTAFGIQPSDKVLPRYLFFFCKSFDFKRLDKSTTIPSLAKRDLLQIPIPLPPLPTQHAIVSQIESLFAELDNGVEHLLTAQQQLKTYRQAVLNHWLNNEDGKWETVKLGEVAEKIQIGPFGTQLHKSDYIHGGIPLINPMHICNKKILPDYSFSVSNDKYKELTNYYLKKDDVILGRRGEMGRCAVVSEKEDGMLCGTGSLFIRGGELLNATYLCHLLSSQKIVSYFENSSSGTTMSNLNQGIIRSCEISFPPLPDQQRIVEEIEFRLSQAEAAEARIAEALQKTEALRQSILKKAFSGELV
jgi:type I restriction enzyme S subunit